MKKYLKNYLHLLENYEISIQRIFKVYRDIHKFQLIPLNPF